MYSRLTTSTMYGSLMDSLMQSQRNLQELQKQIATGSKYTKLSDNPAAVARSLQIQSALNANDKYQTNTQNAVTMLRHSDSALNNVLDAAQAIRALIIQAGDGTLTSDQLTDITAQIEANKKVMLDNLNTRIAGQYIFGGTDTSTRPFVEMPDGSIQYQGTDERIQYAVNDELLGDVSFAGSDIVPENEDSYFICSHYVPLDWVWTGREEKVQITVGNRTLSVFIPEDWKDSDYTKTNTDDANYSDTNGYRDPNEVTGISLTDLADIVNSALEEQGADMLVKAYIETDYEAGRQQLILKSNTGEKVGITGWPDTDYMPTEAAVTTLGFSDGALSFSDGDESKISIMTGNDPSTERKIAMKAERDSNDDLILTITRAYDPTMEDYDSSLPPYNDSDVTTITLGNDGGTIDEAMYKTIMQALADKVNGINGIFARTTSDSDKIVITAERQGQLPSDRLHINEAEEALHYPSLTISAEGNATSIFPFEDGSTTLTAKSENRKLDHSHMDVFDVLGMETAMKSREFAPGETLTVTDQLHWRIMSGGKTADLKLNAGTYTLEDIATRLKNAGAGWVEVTLSEDVNDDWERGTLDAEAKTQRLVIRGYDGEQVLFLDMNEQNYADKLGLST
ncbi:MAG: flagellar hook-associated protein FlgL, partial [Synergistaceae bacterium]|nr:flagellar hook-associated protein FlgL [Synergistaceae bacterium]